MIVRLKRKYNYFFKSSLTMFGSIFVILPSYAEEANTSQAQNLNVNPSQTVVSSFASSTSTNLNQPKPLNSETSQMSRDDAKKYLQQNPQLLEQTLSLLIRDKDAKALAELLPLYTGYPQRDESLIDWANAIIAMDKGDIPTAIRLYRKINAVLPDIRSVRFQLAVALYQDKQYKAAKNELEKLRSVLTNQADVDEINKLITVIDNQDRWTYDFNLNFLDDNNLTNAPPVGTTMKDGTLVYRQPHEEGQGMGYSVGANKKWAIDDRYFTSLHLGSFGKYYWDNKKFNEAYANIGAGVGYQNAMTEVELYPSFTQGWYGGGNNRTDGNDDLERYSQNRAMNLSLNHWLNPKLLYQNFSQYGMIRYEGDEKVNNMDTSLFSNTLVYLPKQTRSFWSGIDYLKGDNTEDRDGESYDRWGVRLGWSEAWGKGISTRLNLGYAQRNYDAPQDFINIERKNKEYDLGVSLWKRDFTLFKLTPRLSWNYRKVKSNSAFEEYSKNNVNLELTQTF